MRYRGLSFIAYDMSEDDIRGRLCDVRDFNKKTEADQDALIEYWMRWKIIRPQEKASPVTVSGKGMGDLIALPLRDLSICTAMKGLEAEIITVQRKYAQYLEPRTDGKTNTLTSVQKDNLIFNATSRIRRLTPTKCDRLQTITDWYRWECADTQIYHILGKGWTVEVIKHVLKYLQE